MDTVLLVLSGALLALPLPHTRSKVHTMRAGRDRRFGIFTCRKRERSAAAIRETSPVIIIIA